MTPGQPPATPRAGASPACGGRHAEERSTTSSFGFPLNVGEKESPHRFRWGICNGRCGDCLRLCFLLSWLLSREVSGTAFTSVFSATCFSLCCLASSPKFFPTLRRQTHHHFIETVDRRVGYPSPVWHRCRPGRQAWRCSPLSPPYSPLRVLQLELSV